MHKINYQFSKKPRLINQPFPNRRKPQLCRRFQRGYCDLGDRCAYSHVNIDLRNQQQQQPITVYDNSRVCFKFMNGDKCEYGDRCHFNHKRPLKTKLCHKWMSTRTCRYGFSCCFAHGESELEGFVVVSRDYGTSEKKVEGKGSGFKWDDVEKISRVYGDWIDDDDTPFVHVETENVAV